MVSTERVGPKSHCLAKSLKTLRVRLIHLGGWTVFIIFACQLDKGKKIEAQA